METNKIEDVLSFETFIILSRPVKTIVNIFLSTCFNIIFFVLSVQNTVLLSRTVSFKWFSGRMSHLRPNGLQFETKRRPCVYVSTLYSAKHLFNPGKGAHGSVVKCLTRSRGARLTKLCP